MMRHRTTLAIDEDVLAHARQLSEASGNVISELVRTAMTKSGAASTRNDIRLLPTGKAAGRATMTDVNRLRDESPGSPDCRTSTS